MAFTLKKRKKAAWQYKKWALLVFVLLALLVIAAQIRPPCLWRFLAFQQYPRLQKDHDCHDVTVVTAYFNLGSFEGAQRTFDLYKYLQWAAVFQYVQNPVVVFTDCEQMGNMLQEVRSYLPNQTVIIRVRRSELQSFQDVEKVRVIFQDPAYPKHEPNTIIPEYPCSQHAKYELVLRALDKGYFAHTKYIAWLDLGYFRYLTNRKKPFYMAAPPGMDDGAIAMTELNKMDASLTPRDIIRGNLVWVGGGLSLGTRQVYRRFAQEYLLSTRDFLQEGLSNTDQQVIYAMHTDVHRRAHQVTTQIKTYYWWMNLVRYCWFYLGYLCYKEVD